MPLTAISRLFLAFPRSIVARDPDYSRCDPHYGQNLKGDDCRVVVSKLPASRRGVEVDWHVNQRGASYNLPMVIKEGVCAVTIEAAGPKAYFDLGSYSVPFTIRSSPYQLRGLAAGVVRNCVDKSELLLASQVDPRQGQGGFATDRMSNLVDFLQAESTDVDGNYPTSSTFITVTIGEVDKNKSPGNFDPTIAVLIAGYLSQRQRTAHGNAKTRLNEVIRNFNTRTQKMIAGGGSTPFWRPVQDSLEEMSYECDAALGTPAGVDCAQVEWGELGADDESFSVGPGLTKVLASNTCHLTISAAITTLLYWRQVRVALDTLLNVCLNGPIGRQQSGGTAYVGSHTGASGGIWGRQLGDGSQDYSNGNLTGLNALEGAPTVNVTVSAQPLPGS